MKPEELRIGNYVNIFLNDVDHNTIQIKIDDLYYIGQKNGVYEPIPVTEEWLLKFGFVKNSELKYHWKNWGTNGVIIITFDETYQGYLFQLGKGLNKLLTNVHQLQNLYFALTGEELIIK